MVKPYCCLFGYLMAQLGHSLCMFPTFWIRPICQGKTTHFSALWFYVPLIYHFICDRSNVFPTTNSFYYLELKTTQRTPQLKLEKIMYDSSGSKQSTYLLGRMDGLSSYLTLYSLFSWLYQPYVSYYTVNLFTILKSKEHISSPWLHASEDHGWTSVQVPVENGFSGISSLVLRD